MDSFEERTACGVLCGLAAMCAPAAAADKSLAPLLAKVGALVNRALAAASAAATQPLPSPSHAFSILRRGTAGLNRADPSGPVPRTADLCGCDDHPIPRETQPNTKVHAMAGCCARCRLRTDPARHCCHNNNPVAACRVRCRWCLTWWCCRRATWRPRPRRSSRAWPPPSWRCKS